MAHSHRLGTALALCITLLTSAVGLAQNATSAIDIGSHRELFVDHYLIEKLDGATLQLHHPQPAGTAITFDRPYEGVFSGYVTVIKDGPAYRMYYRGLAASKEGEALHSVDTEITCYAESRDGIRWDKPNLGLFEINGSRDNNVILARTPACHNFCPFLDTRPGVDAGQRYKGVGGHGKYGLLALVSPDGIHWTKLQDKPIFTKGAFDSQNLAFWSETENCYVCYFRSFKKVGETGYRWISRTTSKDFLTWSDPVEMHFGDVPAEHFYTNQTGPYYRAPHLYVAVFARFMPGREVVSKEQAARLGIVGSYFSDLSEACLMTTRGGDRYDRTFMESFVRPGQGEANWVSRTNYPALGIVPTGENEMSLYVQRHYAQPSHHLQRLTLRSDGFVSVNAPYRGGEMVTRPLTFSGKQLTLNFATSAAGQIQVEIQDAAGRPIPGFTLADCPPFYNDQLDYVVAWKNGGDVSRLAGKPIRLRFVMKDADLYAIRFR